MNESCYPFFKFVPIAKQSEHLFGQFKGELVFGLYSRITPNVKSYFHS